MIQLLKNNWMKVLSLVVAILLIALAIGCQPKVPSLMDPNRKVSREELQIEFDTLLKIFENRVRTLEDDKRLRDVLLRFAFVTAEAGTFNPLSLVTTLAAFYGIGSAATTTTKAVKKKLAK